MKLLLFTSILLIPFAVFSQNTKKVLIIGIDGCRSDALIQANTPNLDTLISNGVYSPDALNDDITISGPGWSAILCGVWSPKHWVTGNDFTVNNYATYPPLFKRAEDYDSALNTVSICHWAPINDYIVQSHADDAINVSTDVAVSTQAVGFLNSDDPDIMFLHYDDVDHAGHSYGFSPAVTQYITAIETVDFLIGTVLAEIELRPTYATEDWLILVSTDHGGVGTSHGGTSLEHQHVFVIASGDNVPTTVIEKDSTVVFDSVYNCMNDTVELAFDGIDDFVQISNLSAYDFGTTQDFSVECRIRTNTAADVAIVGNKDWDSGLNEGFVFSFKYASGPEWKVNIGDGSNRVDINTGGLIADNEWHSLCVTFDRDGYMKMYEDGVLLDSADISGVGDITTGAGLFFGGDSNNSYNFQGSISEVRLWNTVLDAQTVQDWTCIRVDGTHPDFSDMLGYWIMNDGVGMTSVRDYSANLNNGIVNGSSWHTPDSVVNYDFSATPRIVDVPVTAITHMCIPIYTAWGFDGVSLIPSCVTGLDEPEIVSNDGFVAYPNPATNLVQLVFQKPVVKLEVYHSDGRLIEELTGPVGQLELDVSSYASGLYILSATIGQEIIIKKLLKQ